MKKITKKKTRTHPSCPNADKKFIRCVDTQKAMDAAVKAGLVACLHGKTLFTASDSASVTASDSASVRASGSASVTAFDSASVRAFGSASVRAFGSASVRAFDSASVRASKYVAVTVDGARVRAEGGVQIHIPQPTTAVEWCKFYGVPVVDGVVTLFKALTAEFVSPHGMSYAPGTTPAAPDWDPVPECGGGLHFSPRPVSALKFLAEAKRFAACPVKLAEIVVHTPASYPEKVKAPRVCGPCYEVDIDGTRVGV